MVIDFVYVHKSGGVEKGELVIYLDRGSNRFSHYAAHIVLQ